MIISTKGRYAIRVMIDLAEHNTGEYITLMDIANRQDISEKYLESIVAILSKNGLVNSLRGKGGGYKLARMPESYTLESILELTEGSLAPVSCLEKQPNSCPKTSECKTLHVWQGLDKVIRDYLNGITIADLMTQEDASNHYVI